MALLRCALAVAALLTLAGCGGPSSSSPPPPPQASTTAEATELRKDFVILRELVKQYSLQSEAGNTARVEAVERHLKSRLSTLPDSSPNPAEQEILARAQALVEE